MRPIHALVLVAVLALGLLAALFLWTGKGGPSQGLDALDRRSPAEMPKGEPADLAAVPGGGAPEREVPAAVPGDPARASTAPADAATRRVSGRVVDESGVPVRGATVYAAAGGGMDELALDEVDPAEAFWFQRVETRTDAQGRFALDPRLSNQVRLAVRAAGFAPFDAERAISASSGDVGDLVVQRGVVLEGRVIDHVGRPVAGAELRRRRAGASPFLMFAGGGGALVARTDAAGNFKVDQLAAGPWMLRVTSDAHPDKDETGEAPRAGDVVRGLTFQLEEGFEIAGHVSGLPQPPPKGLRVVGMPRGAGDSGGDFAPPFLGGQRSAELAANGTFVLRGCRKDARYRLNLREGTGLSFRSPTRSASVEAAAGERGIELVYRAETGLVFQAVDQRTGAPVTDMSVSAGGNWAMPLVDEKNHPVRNFPEGRVRYGGLRLAPGGDARATLRIEAAGYATYERKDLQLVEGQDNDLGVIRLERTSVVRVLVTRGSDGAPVVGARVALDEVRGESGGERVMAFSVGVGAGHDEEITFGGPGQAQRGRTDVEGRVTLSSLPGKRARITVNHKEFAPWRGEPFDLPVGADLDREVRLSAGGHVEVTVVDPAGKPVAGEAVEHRAPGEEHTAMMFGPGADKVSDADGKLVLRNVAAGVHGFRLRSRGGPTFFGGGGGALRVSRSIRGNGDAPAEEPWVEVTVGEGATAQVRLQAPERASVIGRVREGGRALAGATVRLKEKGGMDLPFFNEGPKADTDANGEYRLESVALGEYELVVTHAGRAMPHTAALTLRSGENRADVELSLSIVEGRISDAEGQPLAGIRVRAERAQGDGVVREFRFAMDTGDGAISFGSSPASVVTSGEDGRYSLRGVQPDVEFSVVATGPDVQRGASEPLRVAVDQTKRNVDLVLQRGCALEVLCKRPGGAAATPCEVRAELQDDEGGDTKVEITNGQGRARFQGLKPGRWRVTARNLETSPGERSGPQVEETVDLAVGPQKQATLVVPGT